MILIEATNQVMINPAIIPIITTVILGVIGFFLIRYTKSIDKKLESLGEDMQHNILTTTTIKTELHSWAIVLSETKTKLEDFISEMRNTLERMNEKFENKSNGIAEEVRENNDNIIRLEEREKELIKKMERLENYQDSFKFSRPE